MRGVNASAEFAAALLSCQREARASFGDDRVLIEKYLQRPRHIEIQVFADQMGNTISLYERDCSAQRRHQKVVEEPPAPSIPGEQRQTMEQAACDATRAVGYVGPGTVVSIDAGVGHGAGSGGVMNFYFMELNTSLTAGHPGIDT